MPIVELRKDPKGVFRAEVSYLPTGIHRLVVQDQTVTCDQWS